MGGFNNRLLNTTEEIISKVSRIKNGETQRMENIHVRVRDNEDTVRKSRICLTGVPEREEREYGRGNNPREND